MSDNPITNVLNLLRLFKQTNMLDRSTLDNIRHWYGGGISEIEVLKIAAYAIEQCQAADEELRRADLPSEARDGLLQAMEALKLCFQLPAMGNSVRSYLPQIEGTISNFALLTQFFRDGPSASEIPEMAALIQEVEDLMAAARAGELAPEVKDLAIRHLHVLHVTLQNVDALGIDAAMAAYAELIIRLKRSDRATAEQNRARSATMWEKVLSWGDRLKRIGEAADGGAKILDHGSEAAHTLLDFFGTVP